MIKSKKTFVRTLCGLNPSNVINKDENVVIPFPHPNKKDMIVRELGKRVQHYALM